MIEVNKTEVKIRVYFDENYDHKSYNLRIKKREKDPIFHQEEKGFYIEKEKFETIKKVIREYEKVQQYIGMKLITEGLI
ncbi:hypothetical protein LCGC14_0664830 [marine sediment metagenome]|uniref:Uncharacterized protein n=1 Tax=marine sediment metagenome TaxID=412755 RepID=A0A0F9RCS4_9ZZZZ